MTSSLVGSEMCIRDRPCCGPEHEWLNTLQRVGSHCYQLEMGGHGTLAVSYTHLTLPTICSV
eukprot:4728-Prorocentrum_lima.AAC.1